MEKIWLKSYPAGVPADIDINQYASLREVLEEACAKYGSRPAYSCMGRTITFADLDRLSAAFGAFLQGRGLVKGTRVALMMPNVLQYPVCLFGVLRTGCTVVNVNPLYTPRELEHQLNDSGAEMIVVVENFAHTLAEVLARTPVNGRRDQHRRHLGLKGVLVIRAPPVKKMIPAWSIPAMAIGRARGRPQAQTRAGRGHDDIAFLQYPEHDRCG
jgi:long-chain acyl-CoA synthetase